MNEGYSPTMYLRWKVPSGTTDQRPILQQLWVSGPHERWCDVMFHATDSDVPARVNGSEK